MSHTPDPRAMGISTNDYCKLLPRRRYSHEAQGRILLLPSTGLVVVPFNMQQNGGWDVVVVCGNSTYTRGGYHLYVGNDEIETAVELAAGEPMPVTAVNTVEEADDLPEGAYVLTKTHGSLRKDIVDGEIRWRRNWFLKKVSLRTDELADELPAIVSAGNPAKEATNV